MAIDDRRAIVEARQINAGLPIVGTVELIVQMIGEELLTVEEADALKAEWESQHRFKLAFASFGDVL